MFMVARDETGYTLISPNSPNNPVYIHDNVRLLYMCTYIHIYTQTRKSHESNAKAR